MDMLAYTGQQYLMLTNDEIRQRSAGSLIKKFILKKYKEKRQEEQRLKSALLIQRIYKGRKARMQSYKEILDLDKYPRLFILKEQKPLFLRLLKELQYVIEAKFDIKYDDLIYLIKEDDKFDTMRVAEPDVFDYKWLPIVQFSKTTALSRIRFAKHRLSHCFSSPNFSLLNAFFKPKEEHEGLSHWW
jgi:hypothetical protein